MILQAPATCMCVLIRLLGVSAYCYLCPLHTTRCVRAVRILLYKLNMCPLFINPASLAHFASSSYLHMCPQPTTMRVIILLLCRKHLAPLATALTKACRSTE